jgi:hypothetical protein
MTGAPHTTTGVTPPRPVQIVRPGGFDWTDAGVGAVGATGLALVIAGLAFTLAARRVAGAETKPKGDPR